MGFENTAGLSVHNHYGPRDTGTSVGVEHSQDGIHQLSVQFTGDSLQDTFLPPLVIPKNARFLRYVLTVDQAFTLTGTTPTVIVGGTAPATNGVVITAAELGTVGAKVPASTGAGTWSTASTTGTTADEGVKVALGGTDPAVTPGVGQATLTAQFIYKSRTVS